MACTAEQLEEMLSARLQLATGSKIASCTIEGDSVQYSRADLSLLNALIADCEAELEDSEAAAAWTIVTNKGLS